MVVHIADSDSESLDEKGQAQTTNERSHCPLNLFAHLRNYREIREQPYRSKINEIHWEITQNREKFKVAWINGPWMGTTSTAQRHELWERGLDFCSLTHYGRKYSTSCRYKITKLNPRTGSEKVVIHDFRTPEGREEAFKYWDKLYRHDEKLVAKLDKFYDSWMSIFQAYIKDHHSSQREVLLLGIKLKVDWCNTKVQELPN